MCWKVPPAWLLVGQPQIIIVQVEPLERVYRDHDIPQRGVRPLHFETLVQVRGDGSLVVIIELIQVLLWHVSLSPIERRACERHTGIRTKTPSSRASHSACRSQREAEIDAVRSLSRTIIQALTAHLCRAHSESSRGHPMSPRPKKTKKEELEKQSTHVTTGRHGKRNTRVAGHTHLGRKATHDGNDLLEAPHVRRRG